MNSPNQLQVCTIISHVEKGEFITQVRTPTRSWADKIQCAYTRTPYGQNGSDHGAERPVTLKADSDGKKTTLRIVHITSTG